MRFLQSDVTKILLYFLVALLLGALLAPVFYNAGLSLGDVTRVKETNALFDWLGREAWKSRDKFPRFFDRSLMFSAVILLVPLFWWIKRKKHKEYNFEENSPAADSKHLTWNPKNLWQALIGFLLAAGCITVLAIALIKTGHFVWRDAAESARGYENLMVTEIRWAKLFKGAVISALVVACIEELLFRGVLLSVFLRGMKTWIAVTALSFLYAFVHFLQPAAGTKIEHPHDWDAGFVLIRHIFERFLIPADLIGHFTLLFSLGVILAVARLRTRALWFPIGLHAGFVFIYLLFKGSTFRVVQADQLPSWWIGKSVIEGGAALSVVLITGVLMLLFTQSNGSRDDSETD